MKKATAPVTLQLKGFGIEAEVSLAPHEVQCIEEAVLEGNKTASWKKHLGKYSKATAANIHNVVSAFFKRADVAIYAQYFKAKVGKELELNSELIAKEIAKQFHVSLEDFLDSDGRRKKLGDISGMALSTATAKMKFDVDGNPVGDVVIEIPQKIKVLEGLLKLAEIDGGLVESLKAKLQTPDVKLNR